MFFAIVYGDNWKSPGIQYAILGSIVLMLLAYVQVPRPDVSKTKFELLVYPLAIVLAGILTFYISTDLAFGPVIASAGFGFVASHLNFFKSPLLKSLPVPIYCGTFVGMCSSLIAEDYFFVTYAGLVAGIIYLITRDALNGIGGKLGSIAFGGVVVVLFIYELL
ncbi:MAG: hypothetical protein P8P74_18300 [Crocinitomicaceae bacterium]|nr:hypothetical protein [Crocinitomicaceae bacterium]